MQDYKIIILVICGFIPALMLGAIVGCFVAKSNLGKVFWTLFSAIIILGLAVMGVMR